MALPLLAGPALATAGRYFVQHGVKKGLQKYGPKAFQQIKETQGLKAVGDKVIKKRMSAAERKKTSFNPQPYKGMTEKQFDKKLAKDYREQLRIDKVKEMPQKALGYTQKWSCQRRDHLGFTDQEIVDAVEFYYTTSRLEKSHVY